MPVDPEASSRILASPTTSQSATAASSGSARAFNTTSGPMPAGSPMVKAITGSSSGMKVVRDSNQVVRGAKAAGLGEDGSVVEPAAVEHADRDAGSEFPKQLD